MYNDPALLFRVVCSGLSEFVINFNVLYFKYLPYINTRQRSVHTHTHSFISLHQTADSAPFVLGNAAAVISPGCHVDKGLRPSFVSGED